MKGLEDFMDAGSMEIRRNQALLIIFEEATKANGEGMLIYRLKIVILFKSTFQTDNSRQFENLCASKKFENL